MSVHEISFPSANGRDTVKAWSYSPLDPPRAIVQIVHGFGEHSRRYLHMIDSFTEAGFTVYADDHIGHGKTAYDSGTLGDPGTKGTDGYLVYLKDEKTLHDIAVKENPTVPFFMFGHSWGSMLARGYAALYGGDIRGLMLCGVVSQTKGCMALQGNKEFEAQIASGRGAEDGMAWMAKAFAGMTDRIKNPNSPNDWISRDPRIVADHAADMFNCFKPKAQLIYDFCKLYGFIESDEWAKKVQPGLPVYLTGGDNDPCGNYGEGVYHVANMLAEAGHEVKVKVYGGYRHEIHNQRDTRADVEKCLTAFVNSLLGA
jgi:alpha-beta hydrolase superfamily lysophospholipase